jgi:HEAT repeat protein
MSFESTLADLADRDKHVTSEQLTSLSQLDDDERREFAEVWGDLEPEARLNLVTHLTQLAEDNVELNFDAIFKTALGDRDSEVRAAAIRGLYEYEGIDLISALVDLLQNDEDSEVRRESAIALGRYAMAAELGYIGETAGNEVRDALIESVENEMEDEVVRARALEAVGAMSGEETENLIESIYREDSLWLKVGAVDAMGRNANDVWLPLVVEEMGSRSPEMRHAAAYAAGEIGSEEAIQPLKDLAIRDTDHEVQLTAVRALGTIGGRRAQVALKSILYEGGNNLRDAVREAIAEAEFEDNPLNPTGI